MSGTIFIAGELTGRMEAFERRGPGLKLERVPDVPALERGLDAANGGAVMVVVGGGLDPTALRLVKERHPEVPFLSNGASDADRYDEMRTEFLARLSHEVRSPLGVIVGVVGELEAAPELEEDSRQLLRLADRGIRRLRHLSDALQEVAELEARDDVPSLEPSQTDVRDVVRAGTSRVLEAESRSHVEVDLNLPEDTVSATLDSRRTERVVGSLVSNAVRFAASKVQITAARRGDEIVIEVEDDGPGVPQEIRPHLFERFSGRHLEGRKGGVALGLSIAHSYVTAHGGTIEVDEGAPPGGKEGNPGARFRVRLPAEPPT